MNKIRCGLIGIGQFGKNYLRLLQDINGVTLRAVGSRSKAAFEIHKNLLQGIKTTTNDEDIFSDPEIDTVFIVTPPSTHYALIEAGLKNGKHVFVEKPMVVSVSEAEKLKTLLAQSGKILMIGYQYLFNESILRIKEEIEKGTFGKILSVKSEHILSPVRRDVDIFWDAGPHPLSIFQYLFRPKKLLTAEGKIEHDKASVKVQFSDGDGSASGGENASSLEITAACFGPTKVRKLTITGEKATAVLDETLEKNKLAITKNGEVSYPEIKSKEPLRTEIEHFINCIHTSAKPITNIDFGCQITEWLETISKKLEK